MNGMFNGRFFFGPRPWGLGEGPKGIIKKLCVSSHKCKRRIFIRSPGSCLRSGTWGYRGGWEIIFYRKSTRFDVLVTYMNCTCNGARFWVPTTLGPWGGAKRSNINKSKSQSITKIFLPNFVCLLTNERYKTYQAGFYSFAWGMPQGWDFGYHGGWRVKLLFRNSTRKGV